MARMLRRARRVTGKVVARYRTNDFAGGQEFRGWDIDENGNVVALSRSSRCPGVCVTVRNIMSPGKRTISRRAIDDSVAIAGGRVAYVEQRRRWPSRIVLADLRGRVVRRLERFSRLRRPLHDLALSTDRLAWAVLETEGDPAPGAPGSIRTTSLP